MALSQAACTNNPASTVATPGPLVTVAQSYVTSVFASDTTAMGEKSDTTMKAFMTPEKLAEVLAQLKSELGALKSQGTPRQAKLANYDAVYIPCKFEKGEMEAKVVLDSSQKVAGFFLVKPGTP